MFTLLRFKFLFLLTIFTATMPQNFYTAAEYFDMVLYYGRANHDAQEASNIFRQEHPNRDFYPNRKTILRAIHRLRETGNIMPNHQNAGAPRRARNPRNEERILDFVNQNPEEGIRGMARQLNLSYGTVQRTLKAERLHAFHYTKVQDLKRTDYRKRVTFCRWILRVNRRNPNLLRRILFTDESHFGRCGTWNSHNSHYWSSENPHLTTPRSFQERFTINIWVGLINNRMVGN